MTSAHQTPFSGRIRRCIVVAVVMGTALVGLVGCGSSTALRVAPSDTDNKGGQDASALGVAGGALPEGVTVFDDTYPAVTRLDPDLLRALRRAAVAAEADGVRFVVNSGWRSSAYQKQLFEEAVAKHGSTEKAARWVAHPGTSVHEDGDAVDVGPQDAREWLSKHGAAYGLCQTYRNEPWHFELRPDAKDGGCPRMSADASTVAASGQGSGPGKNARLERTNRSGVHIPSAPPR